MLSIHATAFLLLLSESSLAWASTNRVQQPFQPAESFLQGSIFAKRPDILTSVEKPTYHAYDEHAPYEGIASFAHLDITNCYSAASDGIFDIGIVGAPFDLGVTYRPGARFGPAGARMGSRRLSPSFAYR
jgi:agmatinase